MDLTSVSSKDNNEQQLLDNNLWWLASQASSLPLPPSAFLAQSLNRQPNGLPPELLNNYHQWLANYHHFINFDFSAPAFSQYPSIPTDGETQPYPTLDPLASNLPECDDDAAFKSFTQQQLFDQLPPLDLAFNNDSQTVVDSSTETSPSSPALNSDFGSSISEFSPKPEQDDRRRRRKSSATASSTRSRRRSSSSTTKSSPGNTNIDRIRERNRISAQRFRDKKKADAIDLEMRTYKLSEQRDELMREITDLQWQSILLQEQCLRQTMCDCKDVKGFFKNKTDLHSKLCQTDLKCHI